MAIGKNAKHSALLAQQKQMKNKKIKTGKQLAFYTSAAISKKDKTAKKEALKQGKSGNVSRLYPDRGKTIKHPPQFFAGPTFGDHTGRSGATSMKVDLGPEVGYGSVPQANTPSIMRDLLNGQHSYLGWVAGHLLNDNLGGRGVAWNLTPLTTAGNKNHLVIETVLKNFMEQASSPIMRDLFTDNQYWFGVRYWVHVSDEKWALNHSIYKHVAKFLTINAKVIKQNKDDPTEISDATRVECRFTAFFDPILKFPIDNTGWIELGDLDS